MLIYEVEYTNNEKTILDNIEVAVLFCRDVKCDADVKIWLNGNHIGSIYLSYRR